MASFREEEEMDSLFEGMELFSPSQIQSDSPPHTDHQPPTFSPAPPPPPQQQQEEEPPSSSSPLPLDENLFSDLTLITPLETQSPEPSPPPSLSRTVSRKKKKPGIRIGYGRDSTSLPSQPSPSPSSPRDEISPPPSTIQSNSLEVNDFEDTHFEIQALEPASESGGLEKSNLEDAHVEIQGLESLNGDGDSEKGQLEDIERETDVDHTHDVGTSGNTTEGRLEQLRAQISEKFEAIRVMAASVSTRRKDFARKRRKAMEGVNLASLRYKELEKELEEACETEDFEKAESVSESLAAAEKEKEEFLTALREAEADCDSFELKMQEVLELQIAAEEEAVSMLEKFAKDAADDANLVLKDAEEISLKETTEWLSSVEALEVKKMELEIESHVINDARSGLNDTIEHLIEDDRKEQEILYKKQDLLKKELENLLALVRQKEAEIVENDSTIQLVEKRISNAVSGFQEEQSNIDTKYYDVQSIMSKLDSERETLTKKKEEIDNYLSQEEKRGRELKELAEVSIDEAKACQELVALRKSLASPILKYRELKLKLGKTEAKILEDVQNLRQEVSAARASLQELSSARSNIQQEVTSVKQRIFFIDKRSPELEAEKRVAASARNFKEAGRIAAEVKTLGLEKENIQTKMEADIGQLGKIEEEINNTVKNLNEKEELILLKEKEAAMSGCERLRLVYAIAMSERAAALELGDTEEANTLLAEAEAANSEASQLQQSYNLQEEEFENTAKDLISIELIANLGRKQLAKMAIPGSPSAL